MTDYKILWDLVIHLTPIILALIVAVAKIGRMIDAKLKDQGDSILQTVEEMRKDFIHHIQELWESQTRQDSKVADLAKDHYRLEGRVEALNGKKVNL